MAREVSCWETDRQTHTTTTVTLAAHTRRGLITLACTHAQRELSVCVYVRLSNFFSVTAAGLRLKQGYLGLCAVQQDSGAEVTV